jgi:hypothetical protein
MTPNLCCALNTAAVCKECGLVLCDICRSRLSDAIIGKEHSGPLYHERHSQCPLGANLFTIIGTTYTYWKKGSNNAPVDDKYYKVYSGED